MMRSHFNGKLIGARVVEFFFVDGECRYNARPLSISFIQQVRRCDGAVYCEVRTHNTLYSFPESLF